MTAEPAPAWSAWLRGETGACGAGRPSWQMAETQAELGAGGGAQATCPAPACPARGRRATLRRPGRGSGEEPALDKEGRGGGLLVLTWCCQHFSPEGLGTSTSPPDWDLQGHLRPAFLLPMSICFSPPQLRPQTPRHIYIPERGGEFGEFYFMHPCHITEAQRQHVKHITIMSRPPL